MPEGDTIHRAANALDRALRGRVVTRFESVYPHLMRVDEDDPLAGRTILGVSARGKHLLIRFSGNLTLRTHMRMHGSWHIYRPGERWLRPERNARIILETAEIFAVAFSVPVAEMIPTDRESRAPELKRLGPDLLSESFDRDEARRRLEQQMDASIADALLNQSVLAGIGNVYKSEVLFLAGVDPRTPVSLLSSSRLDELIELSLRLLSRNASGNVARPGSRQTTPYRTPERRLWVYGRGGRPCFRCGTTIVRELHGRDARSTYWCPSCQGGSS
jgi:endonuclease VIII